MILLATCPELPDLYFDDQLLLSALRDLGIDARAAVWSDPGVDWERAPAVVIRSCWDYFDRPDAFATWVSSLAGGALCNPADTITWNMDKRYLEDLRHQGTDVPEIYWPGAPLPPGQLLQELEARGWREFVCKPAISGGARNTWRGSVEEIDISESRLNNLLPHHDMLLQPYLHEVEREGEWSFIFFGGVFSHAVLKRARPGDFRVQDDHGGTVHTEPPPPGLLAQARAVQQRVTKPHTYARVDGIEVEGKLMLMELELIEPELFLRTHPDAPRVMAKAIAARFDA